MRRNLADAVAANSAEGFAELLDGVLTISSAWRQLR
jgi:flagellar protein FliS